MNITKVRLTAGTTFFDLPIVGASPTDPYQFRGLDGMGPAGVDVYLSPMMRGSYYSGRRPQALQPVLTMGLNPNYAIGQTVSDLRTALYALLSAGDVPVILGFYNGATEICRCTGYVSNMAPTIFSKDPGVQITIDSPDSYLKAPALTTLTPGAGLTNGQTAAFTNPGSAPSGFITTFTLTAADTGFRIVSGPNQLTVVSPMSANDVVTIDTIYGERQATVLRSGVNYSLLASLTLVGDWPEVLPGANNITLTDNTNAALAFNWTNFKYTPQYWGI